MMNYPMNSYWPTAIPTQQMTQPTPNVQQPGMGIIWVQGEAGAKAYPVPPGASVLLMDSERSSFYIKTSDRSGMPMPLRVFDYSERVVVEQKELLTDGMNMDKYVTKDYLDQKLDEIKKLFE